MPIREAWEDRDREKNRRRSRFQPKAKAVKRKSSKPILPPPEVEDFEDLFYLEDDENDEQEAEE